MHQPIFLIDDRHFATANMSIHNILHRTRARPAVNNYPLQCFQGAAGYQVPQCSSMIRSEDESNSNTITNTYSVYTYSSTYHVFARYSEYPSSSRVDV